MEMVACGKGQSPWNRLEGGEGGGGEKVGLRPRFCSKPDALGTLAQVEIVCDVLTLAANHDG